MLRTLPSLLAAGLLACSCGSSGGSSDGGPDGGLDGHSGPCQPGETYCDLGTYRVCQNGTWVDSQKCVLPKVCAPSLGCVDCDPAAGNTCVGNEVHACNQNGTVGALVETCVIDQCQNGSCGGSSDCSAETQLIYVVDESNNLLSFTPLHDAFQFQALGVLSCPAGNSWPGWGTGKATPFSMGVDRTARAWVLYSSGEIFWVNVKNRPLTCQASTFSKGQSGYQLFGMGFVSDSPGAKTEKLYISGGSVTDLKAGNIGVVDPTTLTVSTLGPIPTAENSPELTGTGNAKLYAYFPGTSSTFVAELNKSNGQLVQPTWTLPALSGQVRAWAFAHWGGKFYIFISTQPSGGAITSNVLRLDPATGQTTTVVNNSPYVVVGAGVSTCAPVVEP